MMTKELTNSLHATSCDVFIMDKAQKKSLEFKKHLTDEERHRIMTECMSAFSDKGWAISYKGRKDGIR